MKIAKPGDKSYNAFKVVSKNNMDKWSAPYTITVPDGTFECTPHYFNDSQKPNQITIYYISDKVKFGHVASYYIHERDGVEKAKQAMAKPRTKNSERINPADFLPSDFAPI